MPKKRHNRELIKHLVMSCIVYRLDENTALDYIEALNPTGKISSSFYQQLKREVNSDDNLKKFFYEQAKIGFIRDHILRVYETEEILTKLFHIFINTRENEVKLVISLSHAILEANKRAEELSLSNPIIDRIKQEIDQENNSTKHHDDSSSNNNLSQRKF